MTSNRGLSGAKVFVTDGVAIKVGYDSPNRVIEQGEWIWKHRCDGLPEVLEVKPRGYVMELLEPIPTNEVDLSGMIEALDANVWSQPPQHGVDATATIHKVSLILSKYAPHLLETAADSLTYLAQTVPCLTHGDPTAENVMLRGNAYVLIDPIPSTEAVPDDLAVDVGKLLQSAHGWEEMKGEARASFSPNDVEEAFGDELFTMADRWSLVHFTRTLPYAGEEVRVRVIDKLEDLLGI